MPISRYEIRNEYSLADPELYRAADKDDPEAVLEGVAMAGLVGVLRQLGDLAEFAADIFHNLHEDVMATSARGHAIAVRVQQLENDIPSLERAFLSQTDHSPFFYHPGVDWHQNLRSDKNLITQGDMPRFIMDSYEECRAPPRLFLLDKFDVAGAGACLKRYTDPSFFKDETSEMTTADIHREKKIRKTKKKGPRWKNRETTEVLPSSHTKLHQLFLEERVDNGVSTPFRLAKLKRRLNGFPFNSKSGKSYMEVILKSPSPDHEVLHDMTEVSPQLKLATNDRKEFGYEIFGLRPVSPDRKSVGRKKSTRISPDIEGVTLHPPMPDPDEYPIDDLHPSIATDGISSSLDKVTGEKVVAVDAESNRERSLSGYESDEMASDTDNYVDAPSTMESELDRDFNSIHLRMKNDITLDIKMESLITDAHKEPLHSSFSDSYSTGDSTTSDVGNNSSTKEISSSASDSQNISAEKSPPECFPIKGYQCTDIPSNMIVGASSYQENADEDFSDDQHSTRMVSDDAITYSRSSDPDEVVRNCLSKPSESDEKIFTLDEEEEENVYQVIDPSLVVFDGTCTETNVITNQGSEVEQATSTLCVNESVPPLELSDPEKTLGNFELEALGSDELVSTLDDNEKLNLVIDQPCYPGAALGSQTGNVLLRSSDRELLVDEPNSESEPCLSAEHDIDQQTTDSGVKISPGLLHVDESDVEDRELADDAASTLNINNVLSTNDTLDMMPPGNQIPDEFEDEFPSVPEKSLSDYPYAANNGYSIEPKGDNLTGEWDDEDSNISIDSQNRSSCTMEASPGKGIEETSLLSACTLKVEEHSEISIDNQISMENLNLSHAVNSPDRLLDDCSVHEGDIIPEEDTAVNETLPREISEPCELEGLEGTGVSYYVSPNDSEALKSIHCTLEDLEEPAGKSDTVEIDGISRCSVSNAQEVIEITSPADMRPANEIHVLFNKFGPEDDRNKSIDITSTVSDDTSRSKLIEEHRDCSEDSGMDEFENDNNCQMECSWKMDLVEKVGPTEASASDFGTVCGNPVGSDLSNPELSGLAPISNLDLELDHSPEFVHSAKNKSPIEQCGLDREQEYFNESILENQVPYSPTLPVGNDSDELVQDNIGLPPSHLDQTLAHPVEISSELSSLLPSNYLQILDDDVGKGEHNLVSAFSPANSSSPPSIPEVSRLSNNEISVPGYPKDHFDSLSTTSNPFLETNLAGLPPLPPLPPVEWMMGKLPHALPSADEETIRNEESFPQLISLSAPTADVGSTVSTKPTHDGAPPPTASTDGIISSHEEMKNSLIELASETASNEEDPDNSCSSLDVKTSHEEMKNSLIELAAETASNEEDPDNSCSSLDVKTLHETPDHPPTIENKPRLLATPISESISTSSGAEDGAENVSQKVKFPRPRNPLVDDVSFLDKSKLRKVTERAIPEMSKVDERDSFLEQIRAKSFNLRPAMASRPSIRARGPNTNLKVVAILEKANAIRQALAGSDEDEDSWSE